LNKNELILDEKRSKELRRLEKKANKVKLIKTAIEK
jgi:hypothetical protein